MNKNAIAVIVAGVAAVIASFAVCDVEGASENPATLSVLVHSSWRTKASDAAFEEVGKKYNINFEFEEVADGDMGEQLICAKMATDDVPDILWWQSAGKADLRIGAEKFADLSGDWEKNYDEGTLRTTAYTINDRLVRAPFGDAVVYGVCYNKDVFEKYGLEIPKTWDDLVCIMDKLKETNIIPMYYSGNDCWTLQIQMLDSFAKEAQRRTGVKNLIEGLNTNKIHWTELELVRDAIEKTKAMIDAGYVQKSYLSDTYQDAQMALLEGTCAMYIHATWIENELEKITTDKEKLDRIGFFPIPGQDEETVSAFITPNGFFVPEKSDHKELAIKAVQELVSLETAKVFFSVKSGIPFVEGIKKEELFGIQKDAAKLIRERKILLPAIDYMKYWCGPLDAYITDFCVGNWTAEEMLSKIDASFAKQAEDYGDSTWCAGRS